MAVKSGKDSLSVARFRAALINILAKSGQKRKDFADKLGINYSTITSVLNGSVPASIALMDDIANKMHYELSDMLNEGRKILEGDAAPQADESSTSAAPLTEREKKAYEAFIFVLKNQSDSHAKMLITNIETYAAEKQGSSGLTAINPTEKKLSRSA